MVSLSADHLNKLYSELHKNELRENEEERKNEIVEEVTDETVQKEISEWVEKKRDLTEKE